MFLIQFYKFGTHTNFCFKADQLESNKVYLLLIHTSASCCFKGLAKLDLVH